MKTWWVGCSGFSYKGWKGKFYPEGLAQRKWFEFYCERFNTVELNVTFYRFPELKNLKGWYDRSPQDFKFTIKAPRIITHFKKFANAQDEIVRFYDVAGEGMADKLGSILFQLPPSYNYTEHNLDKILQSTNPAFTNVIEFRHATWWNNDVYKALKQHNITFCNISYPGLPDDIHKTASALYYRFHGIPELYKSSYSDDSLKHVRDAITPLRGVHDVYAYFNNDIDVAAVDNAKTLMDMALAKV